MSESSDKSQGDRPQGGQHPGETSQGEKPAGTSPGRPKTGAVKESGRVAFDARGNPVWEWKESTGVFERNISTQRLKKLQAADLKLEETLPPTKKPELAVQDEKLPGGGFNPYNSGGLASSAPRVAHPALARNQSQATQPLTRQSLATKYANAAKQKQEQPPKSTWEKLKSSLKRDK